MTGILGQPPTRLLSALIRGDRGAALDAIHAGDDVNARDPRPVIGDNTTVLHHAAGTGDSVVVRELIQHGAEVNIQTDNGATPLWFACNGDHFDAAKELLENGADATIPNRDGYLPRDRIRASSVQLARILDDFSKPE
ncbi:ankyrin repeat domain-containing protein [Rhodopirellula sp. MGV]|uniref:ankyrin repeat domain-containing protein n=1 Tax=Rhodopirellula sp. MGV TaxID=2023130 RepID=UPI0013047934|nr:ankyrin repeat domain-containing protein [Rhodopirellula sp. MGV]